MRTLSSTQLAAQEQLAVTPLASLSLRPATAAEDRYQFPGQTGWQFPGIILGSNPFAIAAGAGTLSLFAQVSGHTKYTSFSGSPPVQGSSLDLGTNPDTLIAASADATHLAYVTAAGTIAHVHVYTAGAWLSVEPINTPQVIAGVACAWSGDGRLLVIMLGSSEIMAYIRTAHNVFSGPAGAALPSFVSAGGIAAVYTAPDGVLGSGDWCIAYALNLTAQSFLYTAIFGDGSLQVAATFSSIVPGQSANIPSTTMPGTKFTVAGLTIADTIRLSVFEDFKNQPAGLEAGHNYLQSALSAPAYKSGYLREPIPVNVPSLTPLLPAVDSSTGRFWLANQQAFTYCDRPATTDLSARILAATTSEDESKATAHLLLDNHDGALNSLISLDTIGMRATIQFGLVTAAGAEFSNPRPYWVTTIHALSHSGAAVLDLQAADAWLVLASFRPRRTQVFAAGSMTVAQLIQAILARAGLPFTPPQSPSTLLSATPAFTLTPTTSGIHAVHALLDMVPEVLLFDSSGGRLVIPGPSDAAVYQYSPAGHQVLGCRRTVTPQGLNHVQIYGNATAAAPIPTLIADALDTADAARVGDFPTVLTDRQLPVALAQARADATLRKAQLIQDTGEIATVPNIGLEIWDAIGITYPALNWNGSVSRVRAIQTELDFTRSGGVFSQSVGLQNQ